MIRRRDVGRQISLFIRGRLTTFLGFVVVASGATAAPNTSFSGRWRIDTTTMKGDIKPTIFEVHDGIFKRDDNSAVPADGLFHSVPTDGYVDEQSITIESDRLINEVDRIPGKLAYTVDYNISLDGDTLTWYVASYTSPDGKAIRSETVQRRIGPAKTGAYLLSGTWKRVSVTVGAKSDWILKLDGKRFSSRTDGGSGYDAIIAGAPVKIDGDNSGVRAQITRPRPDLIVETDLSIKGTIDDVLSMQLMPDGNSIRATAVYGQEKRKTTFIMRRQSD